jgi:hypothetical protein
MIGYQTYPFKYPQQSDSAEDYYIARKRKREKPCTLRLHDIFARDRLYRTFQHMKREAGQSPGLDGITYADISPREAGLICRELSKAILEGTYRPTTPRRVDIPKAGKNEFRTLNIRSIFDRVVGRRLYDVLSPYGEAIFLPQSYGFRPGVGAWDLLADLEHSVTTGNKWVIAVDDIRGAFDNLQIDDLINAHEQLLFNLFESAIHLSSKTSHSNLSTEALTDTEQDQLISFVKVIFQGDNPQRTIGIDQGCPYSPFALNLLLHFNFDLKINQFLLTEYNNNIPSWYRYADNIAFVCRDVFEGQEMLERAANLIRDIKLDLKGVDGVRNLANGDNVELLGFTLRMRDNQLLFDNADKAWANLAEHLENAHNMPNPLLYALHSVKHWIQAYGPAFESGEPIIRRILDLLLRYGFREGYSLAMLDQQGHNAWIRWQNRIILHFLKKCSY